MIRWFLQRITGLILLIGLIIHFYLMHYSNPDNISFESVISRLSSPFWKTFDTLFLLSVIYHGFNGIWGIIIEYVTNTRKLRIMKFSLYTIAVLLFIQGIIIILY